MSGYASFNRYFFAQQDKTGAVIDERFNSGGLLDDYMVDYMGRQPIGGVSNDAPGAVHFPSRWPAFWDPRCCWSTSSPAPAETISPGRSVELKVGPIIGTRTWGGLVASSVPYPLLDGGTITAPSSAVFALNGEWPAEGEGIPPDIEVLSTPSPSPRGATPAGTGSRRSAQAAAAVAGQAVDPAAGIEASPLADPDLGGAWALSCASSPRPCRPGGVLFAIGLSLPKTHRAESRLTLEKPPAEVWTVIEILPRWWEPGPISKSRQVQGAGGREVWEQNAGGFDMRLIIESSNPPSRLVTRIDADDERRSGAPGPTR